MYSMPLIQDNLNARSSVEAMVPMGEHLSVIPVMGPQGEVVYYVPGNVPSIPTIMGSAPSTGMRLDSNPNDLVCDLQMMQQPNPDGLMMQAPSNGLVSFNGTNTSMLQSIDLMSNHAGSVVHSAQVGLQHITNSYLVPHRQSNTDLAKHLFQMENRLKDSANQRASLSINETQGNTVNNPMNAFPNLLTIPCLSKAPLSSFEHQTLYSKLQEKTTTEFGPVEKAIFKQALSVQHKKRSTASEIDSIPASTLQSFSELKQRSTKHFGKMFDTQLIKGGNTCNRFLAHAQQGSTISEIRHQPNIASCSKSDTSGPNGTNVLATEAAPIAKPCKVPLLPAIRYHPYLNTNERKKKEVCSEERNLESSISLEPKPFTQQLIASSAFINTTCDVHSVTVPRDGGYTLNKPISGSGISSNTLPMECDVTMDISKEKKLSDIITDDVIVEDNQAHASSIEESAVSELPKISAINDSEQISQDTKDEKSASEVTTDNIDGDTTPKHEGSASPPPPPPREVNLPNPLPSYITKIDKPPSRVLKESLHCTTCDVYVNSDNQMKQHINSLRHKNTLQGIPTPAKPIKDEKPKLRADQYKCNVCKVTLNSDIQLSQHLSSQRHKNMLEGKPPKPRWSPYERTQPALLHPASAVQLPFNTLSTQPLLTAAQGAGSVVTTSVPLPTGLPTLRGLSTLSRGFLTPTTALPGASHLKQASLVLNDGGMLQAREFVYVGSPQVNGLPTGTQFTAGLPRTLLPTQQQVQLQPMVAPQHTAVDWLAAGGLRLTT